MRQGESERRKDRRVRVHGVATVGSGRGPGAALGTLVDVSATGARLKFGLRPALRVGSSFALDLSVADTKAPPGALPIRLRGRALLLRLEDMEGGDVEAGVRFVEPLRVTEAFRSAAPIVG